MVYVLDNSSIVEEYQYYTTEDDRIFRRCITLDKGYDRFKEIDTYEVKEVLNIVENFQNQKKL